eukprot:gnl/TRDRNA2_/TRDRNA2_181010_c0_seq1.p1 gnl/TRDRNA2_/TRDRNA2_181010_c0~~gnl/TRDRNA2_/TRDRNA2_181010_c0_seq1.p1  ORF type:complete len:411 (-),score=56.43 gnl/TRDRNA2_/TRDRNA2_181010_c0_seq1:71-1303(-)
MDRGYRDLESQYDQGRTNVDPRERNMYTWSQSGEKHKQLSEKHKRSCSFTHGHKHDVMTYQARTLTSWQALGMFSGSVFDNSRLWVAVGCTILLAIICAIVTFVLVKDPAALKAGKFLAVGTFLNVFVGVMLGFFLSSSVTRWYSCVTGFLELFDAVRNMQMQCHALGVKPELENKLMRYGVLSVWLLHVELIVWSKPPRERQGTHQELWASIEKDRPGLLERSEKEHLMHCGEPSGLIWTWVCSLVGRMSQDGDIPPMASPTYGRVLSLVQAAHGGIRSINASMIAQPPFIYTHMLATLVHLNNILNALAFGMLLGVTIGVLEHAEGARGNRQIARDVQNLVVGFFFMIVGPILYQALLMVAVTIAQPFNDETAAIPTLALLAGLERDLRDGWRFAENPPSWDKPQFKK